MCHENEWHPQSDIKCRCTNNCNNFYRIVVAVIVANTRNNDWLLWMSYITVPAVVASALVIAL